VAPDGTSIVTLALGVDKTHILAVDDHSAAFLFGTARMRLVIGFVGDSELASCIRCLWTFGKSAKELMAIRPDDTRLYPSMDVTKHVRTYIK